MNITTWRRRGTLGLLGCLTAAVLPIAAGQGTASAAGPTVIPGAVACQPGFVWREAFNGDFTCVSPQTRDTTFQDNLASPGRKLPNGFCVNGFVWREATASDHACVTPATRSTAAFDNGQAGARQVTSVTATTGGLKVDLPVKYVRTDGTITMKLFADGTVQYSGAVENHAVTQQKVQMGMAWRAADGVAYTATDQSSVAGSGRPFQSHSHSWNKTVSNPAVAANWAAISRGNQGTSRLYASWDSARFVRDVKAAAEVTAAVIAVVVAVA